MKCTLLLLALLFLFIAPTTGQITLAHSYGPVNGHSEIVNLSNSGKKIMVVSPIYYDSVLHTATDTINFYNLNYTFWKKVVCPPMAGWKIGGSPTGGVTVGMISYPSETLFNTDPLLEVAVLYTAATWAYGKILIVNETGAIVDSMPNTATSNAYSYFNLYGGYMRVYEVDTLPVTFQAIIRTPTGVAIYNLPGTIPCNVCGNGLGVANVEKLENRIKSQLLPNPSSDQVKITFTLPEGSSMGNLVLYNTNGQKIKSFEVDNRFGFILLNNSDLASGVYYYNIEVNGIVSSTQKMVVIK